MHRLDGGYSDRDEQLDFFRAFLSENPQARWIVFTILQKVFRGIPLALENHGDSDMHFYHLILKKITRERHRMKAFIRFSKSNDGLYFATIDPDFNVLPFIIDFFKKRYADQKWLINKFKGKNKCFVPTFRD